MSIKIGNILYFFLLFVIFKSGINFYQSSPNAFDLFPIAYEGRFIPAAVALNQLNIDPKKIFENETQFLALPSKKQLEKWLPLSMLNQSINATAYPDDEFRQLKDSYRTLKEKILSSASYEIWFPFAQELGRLLLKSYNTLESKPYLKAHGKQLNFPSYLQLYTEAVYFRYPFINGSLFFFFLSFFLLLGSFWKQKLEVMGVGSFLLGFLLLTLILAMRCYVLARPPVSNMYETVLYVPWISSFVGFLLYRFFRQVQFLIVPSLLSAGLLILMKASGLDRSMQNVQAVLDSQFWLMVHVLMIVGSYGCFLLSAGFAHAYLISAAFFPEKKNLENSLHKGNLYSMNLGICLLIPGTILGGVWAAQSWGRFWDWDPKESWAFISICIYLIWIHAYRFHLIRALGLAFGSVSGMMAISFTWYGVNYILGSGLHSYGFGNGGEQYYYLYLLFETLFLGSFLIKFYCKNIKFFDISRLRMFF